MCTNARKINPNNENKLTVSPEVTTGKLYTKVQASYNRYEEFLAPHDLTKVFAWKVEYETLLVKVTEDSKWLSYTTSSFTEVSEDCPDALYVGYLEVSDEEQIEYEETGDVPQAFIDTVELMNISTLGNSYRNAFGETYKQ